MVTVNRITWQDFDVLDSMLAVLSPLRKMTDLLSGEKFVTVSIIKPLLNYLYSEILVEKEGETNLTLEMKSRIKAKLEACYETAEIDDFLSLCSFLDPRFKLSVLTKEEEVKREVIIRDIKKEMLELCQQIHNDQNPASQSTSVSECSTSLSDTIHTTQPVSKKTKMVVTLGNILGKQQVRSTLSLSERVKQELDLIFIAYVYGYIVLIYQIKIK